MSIRPPDVTPPAEPRGPRRGGRVANAVGLVVFLVVLVVLWPAQLGGRSGLTVVSGNSMQPTLQHGDLVHTQAQADYAVGDIVVYTIPEGAAEGMHVIHRIVGDTAEGWVLQGDNRDSEDPWVLTDDDILGVHTGSVSGVAPTLLRLGSPDAIIVIAALLAGAIAWEAALRWTSAKDAETLA